MTHAGASASRLATARARAAARPLTAARPLAVVAVVAVLVGASVMALSACSPAKPPPPAPPPGVVWLTPAQAQEAQIATATVEERDIAVSLMTSARVTFDDLRVAHVVSPVSGRVVRLNGRLGERVQRGDALAVIQSPDVGSAFADLAKAQADLVAAEHEYERQRELYAAHAASQHDFEAAEDTFKRAQAELSRAQQKAALLRGGSSNSVTQEFTLRSPIDGEIIARTAGIGTEVQGQYTAGGAVELFTVGEIDLVWVMADLFEMDLARVQPGARVEVHAIAYPGVTFAGQVDWIGDTVEPTTRTVELRCSLANPKRLLKPEMYVTAVIATPPAHLLAVPRSALLRLGEQMVAFVRVTGAPGDRVAFERRPVEVGTVASDELVSIAHGLSRGDVIVTSGAILLAGML